MIDNIKVTIIHEDGVICKEDPKLFECKTATQILQLYHKDDFSNYVLGLRGQTTVEILRPFSVPISRYPLLKVPTSNNDFSIPKLSLCILNASEKEKTIFVIQPIDESLKTIQFPPFVYSFTKTDHTKTITTIKNEMAKFFELTIDDLQIFLDDKEVPNYYYCQKFIEEAIKKPNLKKIFFKFSLGEKAKEKLIKRQQFVQEMIDVIRKFCSDIIQFHNQVGKKVLQSKVFTDFEYKIIFGSIIDMFNASTRFTTALTGNDSYDSAIGNIIYRFIPDLEENFKEFIANYRTDQLIPGIIKKYKNNQLLESIVHQTFGKSTISFESMAILPIQILPRYKLLFENILKTTPKSHPEYFIFKKNITRIDKTILKLENYNTVREVSYLQSRLVPLNENKNDPLDIKDRYLISKYNVSISLISRGTLYLLNDLIVLTKSAFTHEYEIFRFKYDEFIFFPNLTSSLIVYHNSNSNQFEIMKFQSVEVLKEMLHKLEICRHDALEVNPNRNNALIAYECIPEENQSVPPMIDSSCYKINSLILAASNGVYLTYEIHNQSLNIFKKVRNIHPYAKLVGVENFPFIYGGEKFPVPLEFVCDKFTELKPQQPDYNQPEFGRIFHTCCSYRNYIVIFGGYTPEKKNQRTYSSQIYFFNVKTCEWFVSKPGFDAEPEARYKHSAVIYKNLMIIHGGISCKNDQILDDTWFYNFKDGKWSILDLGSKNSMIIPRFGHSAVMVNQFMFVIGGLTNPRQSVIEPINTNTQITIEKSDETTSSTSTSDSSSNYDTSNSEEEEAQPHCQQPNNYYVAAPNCFCLDIDNCRLFGLNLIGNFLPGLTLFSSIYDDYNKQIILIGGQYQNNKEEKYTSIFTKMSIPQIYTSSSIPNSDEIHSIGRRINRKMSVSFIRPNDIQLLRQNDTKCLSLKDQKPVTKNTITETRIKPSPSTPNPNKLSFPRLFSKNETNNKAIPE